MDYNFKPFCSSTKALFGRKVLNETVKHIAHNAWMSISKYKASEKTLEKDDYDVFEMECKLGRILMNGTAKETRFSLMDSVSTETVVRKPLHDYNARFEASVHQTAFEYINRLLNKRVEELNRLVKEKKYDGPIIVYRKSIHEDRFYVDVKTKKKIRVRKDSDSVQAVLKESLCPHVDVFSPNHEFDWRISFNRERYVKFDHAKYSCREIREKDRRSYSFGIYTIDISMMSNYSTNNSGIRYSNPDEVKYEIEMEVNPDFLIEAQEDKSDNGVRFSQIISEMVHHMQTFVSIADEGYKRYIEYMKKKNANQTLLSTKAPNYASAHEPPMKKVKPNPTP